jgi:molybdopterin synthase sulfur carrier subunit
VRVRLFAQAREAAGRSHDERVAATLGQLLDDLRAGYGAEFAAVLAGARVWVNGDEPLDGDATPLHDGDEVAVLPPVSGGTC